MPLLSLFFKAMHSKNFTMNCYLTIYLQINQFSNFTVRPKNVVAAVFYWHFNRPVSWLGFGTNLEFGAIDSIGHRFSPPLFALNFPMKNQRKAALKLPSTKDTPRRNSVTRVSKKKALIQVTSEAIASLPFASRNPSSPAVSSLLN